MVMATVLSKASLNYMIWSQDSQEVAPNSAQKAAINKRCPTVSADSTAKSRSSAITVTIHCNNAASTAATTSTTSKAMSISNLNGTGNSSPASSHMHWH